MSSYIIDKRDYIKAAGFVSSLIDKNHDFWFFHEGQQRLYDERMIYNSFVVLYRMNVDSVNEQYNENAIYDEESYYSDFNRYKNNRSFLLYREPENYLSIQQFLHSVLYQIEDPILNKKAAAFIHKLIFALSDFYFKSDDCDFWGSFDL